MTARDMSREEGWNFLEKGYYDPTPVFPALDAPPLEGISGDTIRPIPGTRSEIEKIISVMSPDIGHVPEIPATATKLRVMRLINIAGTQYYCATGFFRGLRAGVPVRLVREERNQHDPNAVAVFIGPKKVGYIPRHSNRAIATWMDRGAGVAAEVSAVRLKADPWNRVFVSVTVRPAA